MLVVLLSPMPAAAMLIVLLSLCRPPPCSSCCSRCAGRRHSRHAALAVPATATLAVPLWPGSPECYPTVARSAAMLTISPCCCRCACRECPPCCARSAGHRHSRHAALTVPATATLAVPLWPGSPECYPTVARSAAMLTISPCCCRCACRECPTCCSRIAGRRYARRAAVAHAGRRHARRAALAVPAAAMLVVLLSLCWPPPFSSCCSRCPRYRYARRAAV
ncbi:hypothetical protein PF001_g32209, partial [Phytophthora fragariae]